MSETSKSYKGVSEQSEASLAKEKQEMGDIWWLQELVRFGLPVEISNIYDTITELRGLEYDKEEPAQLEAHEHIERAIELFTSSYKESVEGLVDVANRLFALYPTVDYPDYGQIKGVHATWQTDGSAVIEFESRTTV